MDMCQSNSASAFFSTCYEAAILSSSPAPAAQTADGNRPEFQDSSPVADDVVTVQEMLYAASFDDCPVLTCQSVLFSACAKTRVNCRLQVLPVEVRKVSRQNKPS